MKTALRDLFDASSETVDKEKYGDACKLHRRILLPKRILCRPHWLLVIEV
jgi:hypothetical protein